MLTWSDLTKDWNNGFHKLQSRFPHLEEQAMAFAKQERSRFEPYLAISHDLTLTEAREEMTDFLFIEGLQREISRAA